MSRLRLTVRARLTLIYGVLFLASTAAALGVTYALVSRRLTDTVLYTGGELPAPDPSAPALQRPLLIRQIADRTRDEALQALITQGVIALVAVGVTAVLIGWVVAGRVLRPLQRITDTAKRIAEAPDADRRLHARIALDGPRDEVKELADTFDVMLDRLDRSFDGQRRFIANASHELRTPLTVNRALLEVASARADAPEEVRQLGRTLLEVNARHERLIDGLLLLARSERRVEERSFVDLADVVEHVAAHYADAAVRIDASAEEAPTSGDPVLLERLVQNLVDNAVKYNVEHGWVRVASGRTPDGRALLVVENPGPDVAPYDVPALFEPFRRLGADRVASAAGAGLGLSIVKAIAEAHGGEVVARARPAGGLTVEVALPGERYETSASASSAT
ncbi:signal transduction histidine kinase [Diaminobutyricimonas aerilata]|uniref:histidine kinase n=1 Tax=Diaminobutyricimonas aerilata TaxID=1162967 RepID=A0A2M9CFV1_9MICO|nr:HAMP domain-containing sensor histidine kinase [Diaminobutyricimonas aerilata]PJJ70814.1 signal transduction histidine kinase [Diaminobutyricimonas aerilata]